MSPPLFLCVQNIDISFRPLLLPFFSSLDNFMVHITVDTDILVKISINKTDIVANTMWFFGVPRRGPIHSKVLVQLWLIHWYFKLCKGLSSRNLNAPRDWADDTCEYHKTTKQGQAGPKTTLGFSHWIYKPPLFLFQQSFSHHSIVYSYTQISSCSLTLAYVAIKIKEKKQVSN